MNDLDVLNVVYITGWRSSERDCAAEERLMRQRWPNAKIERFRWDSAVAWETAVARCDDEISERFAAWLEAKSSEELKSTLVLGHSLGARIAVDGLARAGRRTAGIVARGLVLAGAAFDFDSPNVEEAARFVAARPINLYSPTDAALTFYRIAQGARAFGAQGSASVCVDDVEIETAPLGSALATALAALAFPTFAAIRLALLAGLIKDYVDKSHSFCDYLQGFLARRAGSVGDEVGVVERDAELDAKLKKTMEAAFESVATWNAETFAVERDQTLQALAKATFENDVENAALGKIRRVALRLRQLSPSRFVWDCAWDCAADFDDDSDEPLQFLANLGEPIGRDDVPIFFRNCFMKQNYRRLDYALFEKR